MIISLVAWGTIYDFYKILVKYYENKYGLPNLDKGDAQVVNDADKVNLIQNENSGTFLRNFNRKLNQNFSIYYYKKRRGTCVF